MSLINDALKQAQKAPPINTPPPLMPPAQLQAPRNPAWLWPVVILLVVAAASSIGWALARRNGAATPPVAPVPPPVARSVAPQATQQMAVASEPVVKPQPTNVPPPVKPPGMPKLQGIDYSHTDPSAIVDGKTVHPGDRLHEYRVKAISKDTVTLVGPDNKELKLGIGD